MSKAIFYDVSPMTELGYTGIANVTAALASKLLRCKNVDVHFMIGHLIVSHESVQTAIDLKSGAVLRLQIETGYAILGYTRIFVKSYTSSVALFPSVKTISGIFSSEIQIIHDITFIVTPEFHTIDTINHHAGSLLGDIKTNCYTFVDSECTGSDLSAYFKIDPKIIGTAYPGVDSIDETHNGFCAVDLTPCPDVCTYVVVPGTIEPRKNIPLLLRYISENPQFMEKYHLVFFGKKGWLVSFENMIASFNLTRYVKDGRIVSLDFVSNHIRNILYKNAEFTIYPSLYEGFGLPVGEAMSQGCPVCASFSSSIPEVGGDAAIYFDPLSTKSLADAIIKIETLIQEDKENLKHRCLQQASKFTWQAFADKICGKALETLGA